MINEVPIWLQPIADKTQPASAYLITGDEGAGADILALALAAKFSGAADIFQHPDVMIVRPHEKNKSIAQSGGGGDSGGDDNDGGGDDGDNNKQSAAKSKKKKNLGIYIEDAREIIEFCARMPMILERRVVVILQGEKMNRATKDALLKTLEEPRESKMLILRADNAKQLSATIVSRCQTIATPRPSPKEAMEWLQANGGGSESDLHYHGGLPLAIKDERENAKLRAEIIGELNKGAKGDIHAAAEKCAKVDDWFECLQKWAADGARIAAGAAPRYFPATPHLRAPLVRWLDLHSKLAKRREWLDHPLSADLRIKETLHACRQTLAD